MYLYHISQNIHADDGFEILKKGKKKLKKRDLLVVSFYETVFRTKSWKPLDNRLED